MFERSEEVQAAVELLWQHFGQTPRGTLVPWVTIENLLGIDHQDNRAGRILYLFRRRVRDERKFEPSAWGYNRHGEGLYFPTDPEYAKFNLFERPEKQRRATSRNIRGLRLVSTNGDLPLHLRRLVADQLARQEYIRLQQSRALRESRHRPVKPEFTPH